MESVCQIRSVGDNFKVAASLLCALVVVLIGAIYYICRIGFPHYGLMPLIKAVLLAFFLLFLPHSFRLLGRPRPKVWLFTESAMSLWGIILVCLAGLGSGYLGLDVGPVFYFCGFFLCVAALIKWLTWLPSRKCLRSVPGAFLVALSMAVGSFFLVFQDPLIEELIITGLAHRDTLNHASVTSMIKTYGIPSTGLDGIPYHPYHNGSDWILAQVSSLTQIPVLQAVTMAYLVLFVPFLLNTILFFVADVKSHLNEEGEPKASMAGSVFWMVLLVMFVGFMPGRTGAIASQSNVPGLCLVFIFLSLCTFLVDYVKSGVREFSFPDNLLIVVVFPLLMAGIGFTKVSLLWLMVWAYMYVFFRLRLYSSGAFSISFALTIISCLFTLKFVLYPGDAAVNFAPLYIMKWYPYWWPFYLVTEFIWSWLFIVLALYHKHATSFTSLRDAILRKQAIDVEIVAVICVAGLGPAVLLGISDASGGYFVDFQRWFSCALLLANLDAFQKDLDSWVRPAAAGKVHKGSSRLRKILFASVATILLTAAAHSFLLTAARTFFAGQIRTRMALRTDSATALAFTQSLGTLSGGRISQSLGPAFKELFASVDPQTWSPTNLRNRKTLEALQPLSKLPLHEKRESLLYIPRSNRLFWDMPASVCMALPFVAPSVTEIAMIDGLPGPDCPAGGGRYGYEVYKMRKKPETSGAASETSICRQSLKEGFPRIIVFQSDPEKNLYVKRVSCGSFDGNE